MHFMRGAQGAGLLTAAKHFPGHGDTYVDSHIELATVNSSRAELDAIELPPFRSAVREGIDAVLVGHLAVPAIDGAGAGPASLSPRIVGGLLRGEMRFDGLIITDALNMGGVTRRFGDAEVAVLAVEGGADLLLQPRNITTAIDAVVTAVRLGRIEESRIDDSVRRILAAKARVGLHEQRFVPAAALRNTVGSREHADVARTVAERSITLVRDDDGTVPLRPHLRRVLLVHYTDGSGGGARTFEAELARSRTVQTVQVNDRTTARDFDAILARAIDFDIVIASAQIVPREYRGTVEARGGFTGLADRLAGGNVPLIVVSFGSPYLLASVPRSPAYMIAWSTGEASQRAAAQALLGRLPITGRLPVSIMAGHAAGDGLDR
jgi:beta-N-acetylhexosaminidase